MDGSQLRVSYWIKAGQICNGPQPEHQASYTCCRTFTRSENKSVTVTYYMHVLLNFSLASQLDINNSSCLICIYIVITKAICNHICSAVVMKVLSFHVLS